MAVTRPISLTRPLASPPGRLGQLWQLPLFLLSIGLFAYAAYLFIDPKPGLSIDQKVNVARTYLNQERPDAAIEHLNRLLNTEKLDKPHEGQIHLMLAEAISVAESQKDTQDPRPAEARADHRADRAWRWPTTSSPSYEIHRRLAESYEALHNPRLALKHYQSAMALDPDHSLRMQRKIIDLELSIEDVRWRGGFAGRISGAAGAGRQRAGVGAGRIGASA